MTKFKFTLKFFEWGSPLEWNVTPFGCENRATRILNSKKFREKKYTCK